MLRPAPAPLRPGGPRLRKSPPGRSGAGACASLSRAQSRESDHVHGVKARNQVPFATRETMPKASRSLLSRLGRPKVPTPKSYAVLFGVGTFEAGAPSASLKLRDQPLRQQFLEHNTAHPVHRSCQPRDAAFALFVVVVAPVVKIHEHKRFATGLAVVFVEGN